VAAFALKHVIDKLEQTKWAASSEAILGRRLPTLVASLCEEYVRRARESDDPEEWWRGFRAGYATRFG
jgi:hypothetical protein